jgi:hypothetical protein
VNCGEKNELINITTRKTIRYIIQTAAVYFAYPVQDYVPKMIFLIEQRFRRSTPIEA